VIAVLATLFGLRGGAKGGSENEVATSLATVVRRTLVEQTQVDGTLGYAGSSTIVLAAGTARSDLRQAEQTYASAQATLKAAQATLFVDQQALAAARAKLAADRLKQASDCGGANAASSGSGNGGDSGSAGSDSGDSGSGSGSSCSSAAADVASDEETVSSAEKQMTSDRGSLESAQAAIPGAAESLALARSAVVFYETGATYTSLPSVGSVIQRGRALFSIAGEPVLLLYGRATAWRSFRSGMAPGRDVAELNANLRALGYGNGLGGDTFTAATDEAIRALQADHGLPETGELDVGAVIFKAGPVRVKSVTATRGAAVQAGPVLTVSSMRHQVKIALDASLQSEVHAGDKVTITLPDTTTTPGVVSGVGSVASSGGSQDNPTVDVSVRLSSERAAGRLDGAPVQVAITTDTAKNVLALPVTALLARASGGYAVEIVTAAGVHRLQPVTVGLFDDLGGLVEVRGAGLKAGQQVVIPVP
jgi:peptidoglycan hydrolase-like protein with peptidoglycan-binding domain